MYFSRHNFDCQTTTDIVELVDTKTTLAALATYILMIAREIKDDTSFSAEDEFKTALNTYARAWATSHKWVLLGEDEMIVRPGTEFELRIEDFDRDEPDETPDLTGWDEIPSDADRFNLPSSSSDAEPSGMTFRNGVLIEDEA